MSAVRVPGSTERINTVLQQLFQAHGIDAVRDGDVVRFPKHLGLWMNGEAFNPGEQTGQVDFRLGIEPTRTIVESLAGIATSPKEQIEDGLRSFAHNTFHVLVSAFFGAECDHGIEHLEWDIAGTLRQVVLGTIGTRFGFPGSDEAPDIRFYNEFERLLKLQPLLQGTHWVRLYHARAYGEVLANEVMLDNSVWPEMQDAMANFDWPSSENTIYDVRLFLVIRDADPMAALTGS